MDMVRLPRHRHDALLEPRQIVCGYGIHFLYMRAVFPC